MIRINYNHSFVNPCSLIRIINKKLSCEEKLVPLFSGENHLLDLESQYPENVELCRGVTFNTIKIKIKILIPICSVGVIGEDKLRELMTSMGDRWTDDMVDDLFHGAPIHSGLFNYLDFTKTLKHGAKDKDVDLPDMPVPPPGTPAVQ